MGNTHADSQHDDCEDDLPDGLERVDIKMIVVGRTELMRYSGFQLREEILLDDAEIVRKTDEYKQDHKIVYTKVFLSDTVQLHFTVVEYPQASWNRRYLLSEDHCNRVLIPCFPVPSFLSIKSAREVTLQIKEVSRRLSITLFGFLDDEDGADDHLKSVCKDLRVTCRILETEYSFREVLDAFGNAELQKHKPADED